MGLPSITASRRLIQVMSRQSRSRGKVRHTETVIAKICELHTAVLNDLLTKRGVNTVVSVSDGGKLVADITKSMIINVLSMMGAKVFDQYNSCPVCVLEGCLERCVDGTIAMQRKLN